MGDPKDKGFATSIKAPKKLYMYNMRQKQLEKEDESKPSPGMDDISLPSPSSVISFTDIKSPSSMIDLELLANPEDVLNINTDARSPGSLWLDTMLQGSLETADKLGASSKDGKKDFKSHNIGINQRRGKDLQQIIERERKEETVRHSPASKSINSPSRYHWSHQDSLTGSKNCDQGYVSNPASLGSPTFEEDIVISRGTTSGSERKHSYPDTSSVLPSGPHKKPSLQQESNHSYRQRSHSEEIAHTKPIRPPISSLPSTENQVFKEVLSSMTSDQKDEFIAQLTKENYNLKVASLMMTQRSLEETGFPMARGFVGQSNPQIQPIYKATPPVRPNSKPFPFSHGPVSSSSSAAAAAAATSSQLFRPFSEKLPHERHQEPTPMDYSNSNPEMFMYHRENNLQTQDHRVSTNHPKAGEFNQEALRRRSSSNNSPSSSTAGWEELQKKKSPVRQTSMEGVRVKEEFAISSSTIRLEECHSCQVCNDVAAGFHCGAFVCEACKKFFVRSLKQDVWNKFVCSRNKQCLVTKETRTQCQYCRYMKCVALGMYKPGTGPGGQVSAEISRIPCKVCSAPSSGYHFGAITCEGCKGFFRRTVKERDCVKYSCNKQGDCEITTTTRNVCKYCRYQKCLAVGMTPDGSRIGRQPNAIKHATMLEIQHQGQKMETKPMVPGEMEVCHQRGSLPTDFGERQIKPEPELSPSYGRRIDASPEDDMEEEPHRPDVIPELEILYQGEPEFVPDLSPEKIQFIQNQIALGYNDLGPIKVRCKDLHGSPYSADNKEAVDQIWQDMMKQFSQCALAALKFAKKIPGFRELPMEMQISLVQSGVYPIVLVVLSDCYDLETKEYNYFNMRREEEETVFHVFPQFTILRSHFQVIGHSIKVLNLTPVEQGFLCAIILMQGTKPAEKIQEELMISLQTYCIETFGPDTNRHGELLIRVAEVQRANEQHLKAVISVKMEHTELEFPTLYEEMFINAS